MYDLMLEILSKIAILDGVLASNGDLRNNQRTIDFLDELNKFSVKY